MRGELCAKVAAPLRRIAHLGDERGECRIVEPRRRDDDALLVERLRIRGHRPGLGPADVGVVRASDGEADLCPRHERDVRQMRTAGVRIVEDPHVVARRCVPHHRGHRVGHRAEVHGNVLGLRDHPPACVEHRSRAVAPLLDVRRERRANEGRAHLFRDRAQQRSHDLQLDVYAGSQSVRVAAVAYDHAETSRGRMR